MSERKHQDELEFCERCGISFLWTVEERKENERNGQPQRSPRFCPGCRQLLPPPERERGLVKWYNARKNYGFIVRRNAPDLYVHSSALLHPQRLAPDDLVEFSVGASDRGPIAQDVRLLERGKA
jgi:cold shock protein